MVARALRHATHPCLMRRINGDDLRALGKFRSLWAISGGRFVADAVNRGDLDRGARTFRNRVVRPPASSLSPQDSAASRSQQVLAIGLCSLGALCLQRLASCVVADVQRARVEPTRAAHRRTWGGVARAPLAQDTPFVRPLGAAASPQGLRGVVP